MADTISNVKELTAAVEKLTSKVDQLAQSWSKVGKAAAGGFAPYRSLFGGGGAGFGGAGGTGGVGGGTALGLGLGGFSSVGRMAGATALAAGGALYGALPNMSDVLTLSTGYYGAARIGGVNRARLERSTLSSLAGGVTSPTDAMGAAAMLSQGYFFTPGGQAYNQIMREVGGAARYLNMENPVAAQALGGFSAGAGSAGSLYRMGISTYNMKTGQPRSFGEIVNQIYARHFPRGGTPEQIRQALSMGQAGMALRSEQYGLSAAQQELVFQGLIDKASGKNPDLAQAGSLTSAQGAAGNANPALDFFRMQGSEASKLRDAEQPMLDGFKMAADAVVTLNKALEGTPELILQMKGAMQGFGGSSLTGGLGALGTVGSVALGSFLGSRGAGVPGARGNLASKASNLVRGYTSKPAFKGIGAGAAFTAGSAARQGMEEGSLQARLMSALQWGGTGLIAGGVADPLGWGLGALGAVYGFATGGGDAGFTASFSTLGKGGDAPSSGTKTQAPISGASITASFGQKGDLWKSGSHTGQDYGAAMGTPVKAIADGTVLPSNSSEAYGTNIVIDHGGGYTSLYGHLSSKSVNTGSSVSRGQVIGKVGKTGNATGPHLHLEVRKDGHPIDPEQFLKGSVADANPNASGSKGSESSSVASLVLGNAPGIDLSGGFDLVSSLFDSAITSTLRTTDPSGQTSRETGAGIILGTGDQQAWARKFLNAVGAPLSEENLKAMTTWMAWEGGHWKNSANYNPLNTTQPESGATSMNSVGVKRYKSWEQGLQATVETIKNGRYSNIMSALMRGDSAQAVISAINDSPWGTHIKGGGPANQQVVGVGGPSQHGMGTAAVSAASTLTGSSRVVNLNVYPRGATDEDAKMLAKMVKKHLDNDTELSVIGGQ